MTSPLLVLTQSLEKTSNENRSPIWLVDFARLLEQLLARFTGCPAQPHPVWGSPTYTWTEEACVSNLGAVIDVTGEIIVLLFSLLDLLWHRLTERTLQDGGWPQVTQAELLTKLLSAPIKAQEEVSEETILQSNTLMGSVNKVPFLYSGCERNSVLKQEKVGDVASATTCALPLSVSFFGSLVHVAIGDDDGDGDHGAR